MSYKKGFFLLLVFIIVFFLGLTIRKIQLINNYSQKETKILFINDTHNFKKLSKGNKASVYFIYKNIGKYPLKITDITTSCGCTVPIWSKKEILPDKKDSLLVMYDSEKTGKFLKEIYIFSNSTTSPDVLYIKGVVVKNNSKN